MTSMSKDGVACATSTSAARPKRRAVTGERARAVALRGNCASDPNSPTSEGALSVEMGMAPRALSALTVTSPARISMA